ncbi:MAG: anthranilate phosphoribosyltransferase [Prolixibacteraceae bacterium]|jgi:anthranilate phosphoribosyltransferase|nr:anthranilate phosphoribosyltransferase [Prolixibacteraceae bacterium]
MKATLQKLIQHKTLNHSEAKSILKEIAADKLNPSQVTAFITVFMMRNITPDELSGFRDALLDLCIHLDFSDFNTIDLCGTGGDGKNTFNISTLSSLVVAGAGYKVSKHGNYGVSSACGSSNVMEYFGYKFTNDEEKLKKQMDEIGYVYLHAPFFHPAMKSVGPIRRELSMKTFFNMLGPMVNPSQPQNQIVGVYDLETMRLYSYIYQQTNKNFSIVYALDGYDEISLTSDFKIITNTEELLLNPEKLGLPRLKQEQLFGGDTVEEAATIFKSILDGNGTEAQNSAIYANAGMAIRTINPEKSIDQSIEEAKKSLLDGEATKVLKALIQY